MVRGRAPRPGRGRWDGQAPGAPVTADPDRVLLVRRVADGESVPGFGETHHCARCNAAAKAAMASLSAAFRIELAGSHPGVRVVVYPGRIATDFGRHALGQRTPDGGSLPAEVLAVIGGATQTAEEVAHVVCDAALDARGDVYTQPDVFARVREYLEKQQAGQVR